MQIQLNYKYLPSEAIRIDYELTGLGLGVKKAKKKELVTNAIFEKEMAAATTYRDPFLER